MPLNLTRNEKTTTKVVEVGKISEININVNRKEIEVIIDYGTMVNNVLKSVDRETIIIEGNDFTDIAGKMTGTTSKTIYDALSDITYAWLVQKNKLKYTV